MKVLYSVLFILSVLMFNHNKSGIPVEGYSLVWHDEFSANKLDMHKWAYRGLGKRDEGYNTKDMVSLDGKGHLIMKAMIKNDSILTSMISTDGIIDFKYGYFECRAKFAKARGTISAFWLQSPQINVVNSNPETNGAEIDMFEYFPNISTDHVLHTLHWGGYGTKHHIEGPVFGKIEQTADSFHTIGFEWADTSYTTYVDGNKSFSGNQLISKVPEFLILSLLVNQSAAGVIDKNALPSEFVVDYVRVYKKDKE